MGEKRLDIMSHSQEKILISISLLGEIKKWEKLIGLLYFIDIRPLIFPVKNSVLCDFPTMEYGKKIQFSHYFSMLTLTKQKLRMCLIGDGHIHSLKCLVVTLRENSRDEKIVGGIHVGKEDANKVLLPK